MQQQIESKADWAFKNNPATDSEIRAVLSAELPDLHRNATFLITHTLRKLLTQKHSWRSRNLYSEIGAFFYSPITPKDVYN